MKISDTVIGSIIIGVLVGGAILLTGGNEPPMKQAQFVLGAPHSDHAFFADKGSNKKFKHKAIIIDLDSDSEIGKVDSNYLLEVLTKMDTGDAEALFISCTALPALEIIQKLENKIKILDQTDYFSENITRSNLIKQLWVEKSGERKIIQASVQMSRLTMKAIINLE